MSKNTYWIASPNGLHAQVEGVEERDRWTPRGWRVVGEPKPTDFVYMRKDGIDQPAPFAYGAAETWQQMEWTFCPPPEPVDVTKDPNLFDQPEPVPAEPKPTRQQPATGTAKNDKE